MYKGNFVDRCLAGEVTLGDIDLYVEQWHEGTAKVGLPEYLGMSMDEYSLWVEKPEVLPFIARARKFGKTIFQELKEEEDLPLAARGASQTEVKEMRKWLQARRKVKS